MKSIWSYLITTACITTGIAILIELDSRRQKALEKKFKEWKNDNLKHAIYRFSNNIYIASTNHEYFFLAFHTVEQRNLFLDKYRDLVKDYLMIG